MNQAEQLTKPSADPKNPMPQKRMSMARYFLLGAGIEAGLNAAWLAYKQVPIKPLSMARNAVFSGIAGLAVSRLSHNKAVADLLSVPNDPPAPAPAELPEPPTESKHWETYTAEQSSQNRHTPAPGRR